jgi:hypothetical protein
LNITAGNGMQITGNAANKTINLSAFRTPIAQVVNIPFGTLPTVALGAVLPWITDTLNPIIVPSAGVYLCQYSIFVKGLPDGSSTALNLTGEGYININGYFDGTGNPYYIQKQYFSMTQSLVNFLEVNGNCIFFASDAGYITADACCTWLGTSQGAPGTRFTVEQPYAEPYAFMLYKLY